MSRDIVEDMPPITKKHPFALSGLIIGSKNKDFKGELLDDLSDSDTDPASDQNPESSGAVLATDSSDYEETTSKIHTQAVSMSEEFTTNLIAALSNKKVMELLNRKTNEILDRMDVRLVKAEVTVKETEERTEKVEAKTDKIASEMETIKKKLDDYDQKERATHIIVSGNIGDDYCKKSMAKLIHDKLKIPLKENDINYTLKLGRAGTDTKRVRVVLKDVAKKAEIAKAKKILKGQNIWITDDLTPMRSNLAFQARNAVKAKKIHMTWVADGNVLVKMTANSQVKRILDASDIPN